MFRLCVVGSGGVGKSSLTIRYLKNEFTEVNMPVEITLCSDFLEFNHPLRATSLMVFWSVVLLHSWRRRIPS